MKFYLYADEPVIILIYAENFEQVKELLYYRHINIDNYDQIEELEYDETLLNLYFRSIQ